MHRTRSRVDLRDDQGQMMAPLVIFLGISVLSFFAVALFPIGAATNEKSRSQTAADAAALAGAEEIRTQWVDVSTRPGLLIFPLVPIPPVTPVSGSASAASYAQQNDAHVIAYYATPTRGRTYAKVRNNYRAYDDRGYAESEATAEMDANFLGCRWDDYTLPSPLPYGPPTFTRTLNCGDWEATYLITNGNGYYPTISYVGTTSERLFDDLEPRLVE